MKLLDNSVFIYQEACLSVTRDRKDFCDFFILSVSSVIYITESWEECYNCVMPDILQVYFYSVLRSNTSVI